MKNIIKKILTIILHVLALVFFGVSSVFLFKKKNETVEPEKIAEEKKEEKEDEIKKTDAGDLVAESPNQQDISTTIGEIKSDYRERVRNRLNSDIHR